MAHKFIFLCDDPQVCFAALLAFVASVDACQSFYLDRLQLTTETVAEQLRSSCFALCKQIHYVSFQVSTMPCVKCVCDFLFGGTLTNAESWLNPALQGSLSVFEKTRDQRDFGIFTLMDR